MELIIKSVDGRYVADSLEIAEMTKKRHDNLLRDIDVYVDILRNSIDLKFEVNDFFIERTYQDSIGRTLRKYDCTRKGCDMIANKMTGQKGVLFTAVYVTKFEVMEKTIQQVMTPSYMIGDPEKRALKWIEEHRERKDLEAQKLFLEQKVTENASKVSYLDTILQSKGLVATTQIAKDYGMSAVELNELLRDLGIQYKVHKQWVLYAKYADKGYTQSYSFPIKHKDGRPDVVMNTQWTQQGRLFVHNVLAKQGIKANIDKEYSDAN